QKSSPAVARFSHSSRESGDDEDGGADRVALEEVDGGPDRNSDAAVADGVAGDVTVAVNRIAAVEEVGVVHRAEVTMVPAGDLAVDRESPPGGDGEVDGSACRRVAVATAG